MNDPGDGSPRGWRRIGARLTPAAMVVTTVVLIVLFWKWILLGVLVWTAGRHLLHRALGDTRPRPRSSWSSLLRSGAIAYAAWNSRSLPIVAKSYARSHDERKERRLYDEYGEAPF